MSLLTALIIKNSHILAGIYFAVLKKRPRPKLLGKLPVPNLLLSEKIGKVVIYNQSQNILRQSLFSKVSPSPPAFDQY